MRVAIVGGGPAGLTLAFLLKESRPHDEVLVLERNAAEATFGFGVVFSDRALHFVREGIPDLFPVGAPAMQHWPDITIARGQEQVAIDGNGFSSVGRLELLRALQERCRRAGVDMRFELELTAFDAVDGYDLVVGADGVNSLVRERSADGLGPEIRWLTNRYVWYGTTRVFDTLTLTFRDNADGAFVAHHYRYSPGMSTFIVECDASTFERAGLVDMSDDESRAYCEQVFAHELAGHPLVSNQSQWRSFPVVSNRRWHHGNRVLLGDALRTVHFSIGSGTRLAMEDAIFLHRAILAAAGDLPAALAAFERERRPVAEKVLQGAAGSYEWYETFHRRMHLDAFELAYDYMTRSGRVDDARLRQIAPRFVAALERHRGRGGRS